MTLNKATNSGRQLLALSLALALVLGLSELAGTVLAQAPKAPGQGPGPAAPVSSPVPARPSYRGPPRKINWMLWGGIGGGAWFLILGRVAVNQKKKSESAPPSLANGVIGGYRLLNLMMTGQSSQVW